MTAEQRDELLMQMFKSICTIQESINSLNNKLENTRAELKQDIADLEERLNKKIEETRAELKQDMADLEQLLNKKIEETKAELEQKIEDVRTELKQDIANSEENFDIKLRENAKATAQIFRDTWKREEDKNNELDSKIIKISDRIK